MISRQFSVTSIFSKFSIIILFFSVSIQANEQPQQQKTPLKQGKTYISASLVLNEFRSLTLPLATESGNIYSAEFPLTAQTYALGLTYGTYITENFKTELRYGTGIIDDTLDSVLDININYYFNWYIGGTIPVTDYLSAYALIGVSFYDADMTRREEVRQVTLPGNRFPSIEKIHPSKLALNDDLFGTKFSMSWMLGFDYKLDDSWYIAFEYGRLLKDTDTNIKVYQAGTQLRYEF